MRWQTLCLIVSVVIFAVVAIIGFHGFGSHVAIDKEVGLLGLGSAFFAAAHLP